MRGALPILVGVSVMLSLSMGLRQSFGLFLQPLTRDIAITVSEFTLAIAVQNLAWGFLQPLAGALTARWGFRPIMLAGSMLYVAGLALMATAQGFIGVLIGAGVLIGMALACTAAAIALAAATRSVSPALRSTVLGIVTGAGSLGALISAPMGQVLTDDHGWRVGLASFVLLALLMIPAAWIGGRVDRVPLPPATGSEIGNASMKTAMLTAFGSAPFMVMACAYFVCGMQLIFVTTHLPSYLALCGLDPMLNAQALGVIGGFNVLGCLFFGWAGGRWNKLALLGGIYVVRSLTLALYFMFPPTPLSTLVFAAVMGFVWLGVGPLVSGSVAEMFGLRWQAMIAGLAFMGHQIGSFVGAFGGGVIFDSLGSYNLAWQLAVLLGLLGGTVQIAFALYRPPRPPLAMAAG
jgi:predicted MFS family arabinose efflux permease